MGGVSTGRDALELIACGANHVALGTVLFAGIVFALVALIGLLRRRLRPPPAATREQRIAWAATLASGP